LFEGGIFLRGRRNPGTLLGRELITLILRFPEVKPEVYCYFLKLIPEVKPEVYCYFLKLITEVS